MEKVPAVNLKKEEETEDILARKCNILKRKCREYEEMNSSLLAKTKKICSLIEDSKREKNFLIKRLEQFEVLEEVPRSTFSLDPESLPEVEDQKELLVAAVRIRAELNAELARLKTRRGGEAPEHDSSRAKPQTVSNNTRHTAPANARSISPVSALNPAHSHDHVTANTPLQSPVASVISTPSSLVPASVPKSYGKVRKTKLKVTKAHGRGSGAAKRKRPDADPNAPKKPSNAFFWFCQEKRAPLQEQFRGEGMSGQHDLTKALARLWSETASEEKKKYYHKYNADKARYDKEMKEYTSMMKQSSAIAMDTDSSNDSLKIDPMA